MGEATIATHHPTHASPPDRPGPRATREPTVGRGAYTSPCSSWCWKKVTTTPYTVWPMIQEAIRGNGSR